MSFLLKLKSWINSSWASRIAVGAAMLIVPPFLFWLVSTRLPETPVAERLSKSSKWQEIKARTVAGRLHKPGSQVAVELSGPEQIKVGDQFTLDGAISVFAPSDTISYTWLVVSGAESQGTEAIQGNLDPSAQSLAVQHTFKANSNDIHIILEVKSSRGDNISGQLGSFIVTPVKSGFANGAQMGVSQKATHKGFEQDGKPVRIFQ